MARLRVQTRAQDTHQYGHVAKDTSFDSEVAKTESQQMLALPPLLKKPKIDEDEVYKFRAKVAADQNELKARLQTQMHQAEEEETRRRNEVASIILGALQPPKQPTRNKIPVYAGTKIASNAVYASATHVLAASEALVAECQRLDDMVTKLRTEHTEPIAEKWKQDISETEAQLKMGARVALRNVKKVLGAEFEGDGLQMTNEKGTEGDMESLESVDEEVLNFELQKSLRYAMRGVKRMVKALPDEAAR